MHFKRTRSKKFLSIFAIIITSIMSCSSVFAYKPLNVTNWNPKNELTYGSFYYFLPDSESSDGYMECIDDFSVDSLDFSAKDSVFIYETDENIQTLYFNSNIHRYATCSHSFQTGTLYNHIPDGKGGCTLKIYNTVMCIKCHYKKSQTLINTIKYQKCPH